MNPYLEAVIEVNPDASTIAAELDNERRAGRVRGMLHGIPVLIKDVRNTIRNTLQILKSSEYGHSRQDADDCGLVGFAR